MHARSSGQTDRLTRGFTHGHASAISPHLHACTTNHHAPLSLSLYLPA